jgi:hypothetical protein
MQLTSREKPEASSFRILAKKAWKSLDERQIGQTRRGPFPGLTVPVAGKLTLCLSMTRGNLTANISLPLLQISGIANPRTDISPISTSGLLEDSDGSQITFQVAHSARLRQSGASTRTHR